MPAAKRLSVFERYLSLWVALCIAAGIVLGRSAPGVVAAVSRLQRYVLVKLSRSRERDRTFLPALVEFGLAGAIARGDGR